MQQIVLFSLGLLGLGLGHMTNAPNQDLAAAFMAVALVALIIHFRVLIRRKLLQLVDAGSYIHIQQFDNGIQNNQEVTR